VSGDGNKMPHAVNAVLAGSILSIELTTQGTRLFRISDGSQTAHVVTVILAVAIIVVSIVGLLMGRASRRANRMGAG